ncbi:MAG: VWA domain-containing protein [Bacteroidota bacterium]
MPEYLHHSNYNSLSEAFVAFGQAARENGLNVGIQESLEGLRAAENGLLANQIQFYYALKAIYCNAGEEVEVFDELFEWFWQKERNPYKSKTTYKNQSNLQKKGASSLVMLGKGKQEGEGKESKNISGANEVKRLRKTDFSKLSEIESDWLEKIALKLWREMLLRLKRKMKQSSTKGIHDLRRIIRSSIAHGGDPIELKYKNRKPRKQRLIVLLDVSGSMDKYSFFLLRFVCMLRSYFEQVEAFLFSTHLVRITEYLDSKNLETTLRILSARADNWSSGTKIGECFKTFNEEHAKRILNGHSTVIVLSDGLDTGKPEDLAQELKKIKLRTRKLIWLNPLKGMQNYQPIQQGMSAALPELDIFQSAHNLDSILELENFLQNV